jgi:hypothetical protein
VKVVPLDYDLAPAAVVLADCRHPIPKKDVIGSHVKITPELGSRASKKAMIRFNRRQVFNTEMNPLMSVAMLVGPVATFGGGRFFTLRLGQVSDTTPGPARTAEWSVQELWSPEIQRSNREIVEVLNARFAATEWRGSRGSQHQHEPDA